MATNLSGNTLTLGNYLLTGWRSGIIMVPYCSSRTFSASAYISLSVGEFSNVYVNHSQSESINMTVKTTGSCIYINGPETITSSSYGTSFNLSTKRYYVFFRVS